tara:strand:- start:140 stop:364 length:225 start_codon:yes stop_codon:yes gene_type:complete
MDKFVPIEKVAEQLGVSVCTTRSWIKKKAIPENTFIKVDSTYRFNLRAVVDALTSRSGQEVLSESDSFDDDEFV